MSYNEEYSRSTQFDLTSGSDARVVELLTTTEPVTLIEAKNYLRIRNDEDDLLITNMITQARVMAEAYTNSDILSKRREQYFTFIREDFNLYNAPILEVESVEQDGTATTDFEVLGLDNPLIRITALPADKIKITYTTTGRTDTGLKQGILCNIAYLYYGRDATMSTNYKPFLAAFKIHGYYGTR